MADLSRSSNSSDSDSGSASDTETKSSNHGSHRASGSGNAKNDGSGNVFKNDGSFMEMFKKMQDERNKNDSNYFDRPVKPVKSSKESDSGAGATIEENSEKEEPSGSKAAKKPSIMSFVGKRRGGRILPTGTVKKPKKAEQEPEEGEKNDAWSRYLSEVRKYREQSCEEEGKRRPLVK